METDCKELTVYCCWNSDFLLSLKATGKELRAWKEGGCQVARGSICSLEKGEAGWEVGGWTQTPTGPGQPSTLCILFLVLSLCLPWLEEARPYQEEGRPETILRQPQTYSAV